MAAALATSLLLGSDSAQGHAVLERSTPSANQSLEAAPSKIELWFTERIDHSQTKVRLLNASGEEVPAGSIQPGGDPRYGSVALKSTLAPGVYTVVYDNLSRDDGHRWQGFFPFIVLNPDGSQPAATALPAELTQAGRSGQLPGGLDAVLKWASLIAAVVIVGASIGHLLVVSPASSYLAEEDSERVQGLSLGSLFAWSRAAALVLVIGAGGQALLLVDRLGGLSGISDVLLDTRPGRLWLIRIGLALAAGVLGLTAWRLADRFRAWALPLALAGLSLALIAAYSLASHAAASATGGETTAVIADFIHFAGTGLWLGVLAQLALVWRPSRMPLDERDRLILSANLLDRFSALAVISAFVLLVSGVFSALVQIPEWSALWQTTYGIVLLVKLALVLPLLAAAGVNALYLKPALVDAIDARYAEDEDGHEEESQDEGKIERLRSRMVRSIGLELGLGVLVLASVAVLTQTGTARGEIALDQAKNRAALAGAPRQHETFVFNANKVAGDLAVSLRIDPQLVGINTYRVELTSAEAREIGNVEQVSLRFFYYDPAFGSTDSIDVPFDSLAPGGAAVYELQGAYFSIGGGYRVQVDVKRTDTDDARAIFPLQVEDEPEARRESLDFPFYIGTRGTTTSILLLLGAFGLVLGRSHFGAFASWGRPAAELLAIALFAGSATLAVGAVVSSPQEAGKNPVPLTAESVERGKILFMRNCASCHGDTGRGDGAAGVNLKPQPADFLVHVPYHGDSTLYGWISNGVQGTGMPAWGGELTEQERWDLVNFLRQNFGDEVANQRILEQATPTPAPP